MKVLYYKETDKYLKIAFNHSSNGIIDIESVKRVDCLWDATVFNKPVAIAVFNMLYHASCYTLELCEVPNHVI